jgi:archaellum component FlaC
VLQLSASSSIQVSKYSSYTQTELIEILSTLSNDLLVQNHIHTELKASLKISKTELNDHKLTIEKLKSEIKDLKVCNSNLLKEANDFKSKFLKTETILVTWSNNAKKAAHACKQQIPRQVQAIIGGDYDAALAYGEISVLEPSYFPENPDDKTIKKINKMMNQNNKKNNVVKGKPVFKKSSTDLDKEKVYMDAVYTGAIPETESFSQAESSQTNSACQSQNKLCVNESKPNPMSKPMISNEKRSQRIKQPKVLKKVKSVSASRPSQSETNKTIAKLVESRLNEISKEVNFLKSLSEVKSSKKSQTKAKNKLKPKKVTQAESSVAQAEKPIIKQQWIPKPIKQVTQQVLVGELMCDLSSGEPISGWVPDSN